MIELYNSPFDEEVAKLFLKLREELKDNLIKVEGDKTSRSIKVYVYKKVIIEGVEVFSLEEMIKEILSSIAGITFSIQGNKVKVNVNTLRPDVYEEVTVKIYEIEKNFGIKLDVEFT